MYKSLWRWLSGRTKRQSKELMALVAAIEDPIAEGDEAEAERRCQELSEFLMLLSAEREHLDVGRMLGAGYFDLGSAYRRMRRQAEAEAAYGQAVETLGQLTRSRRHREFADTQLAACRNHLGLLFMDAGASDKAAALLEEAIALRKALLPRYPKNLENKVYLGGALCNRAHVAREAGDSDAALRFYGESIATLTEAIPPCDCGCRDAMAAAISQLTGQPHWIIQAQQFRQSAEAGRELLAYDDDGGSS